MAGMGRPLKKLSFPWLPLLIFSLAFILRLIYILEIRGSPFWDTFILDQRWYDEWARKIAGGEFLGREVFFLNPLYAYFLALIYLPAGRALWAVRLIQAAMGGLSCCLIWAIGRRLFGEREGVLAGLLGSAYGIFIFYDSVLAVASLATFLNLLLLFYLLRTGSEAGKREGLGAGILLGLSVLARPNVLLFYPFIAAFWFLKLKPRKAFGAAAMSLLGAALMVAPVTLRHLLVAGDFVPFTSSSGINLFIGNNPKANGTFSAPSGVRPEPEGMLEDSTRLAEKALGRKLKPSEVSGYWRGRAVKFWKEEPGKALFLYLKKLALFWNGEELGGTYNFPYFRGRSWSLRNNPVGFGLVAPLALLGMGVFLRRFKELLLPYGMVLSYAFGIALIFVVAQYRAAAVPFILLFASTFIFWAVGKIRALQLKPLLLAAAIGGPLALGVNYPMVGGTLSMAHTNMGVLYDLRGFKEEAEREFREALKSDPENVRALNNMAIIYEERGELGRALSLYQRALALRPDYLEGRANYASALLRGDRYREGLMEFEALLRERPDFSPAYLSFSSALLELGRGEESIRTLRRLLELRPTDHEARARLAATMALVGDYKGAAREYREALALEPDDLRLMNNLGNLLVQKGLASDEGLRLLERAHLLAPGEATILDSLGWAYYHEGRYGDAARILEQALRLLPREPEVLEHLALTYEALGRGKEALSLWQELLKIAPENKRARERARRLKKEDAP